MKLDIPYYSQHRDVQDENWKKNSCAVVCLKMVMDFLKGEQEVSSIDDLIKEGVLIGAHTSTYGWIHAGLVRLAHNHGFCAYNEEFRSVTVDIDQTTFKEGKYQSELLEKGIIKIQQQLEEGLPVIVSCAKQWKEEGTYHQVVLTGLGVEDEKLSGFYYHEPDQEEGEAAYLFVDVETFKKYWRKFAIFVGK